MLNVSLTTRKHNMPSQIHSLKTALGIAEAKIKELEARIKDESIPASPLAETTKETIRQILSFGIGLLITSLYQKYPILGQLQPDQVVLVAGLTGLAVRGIDKLWYVYQKNKGKPVEATGLDLPLQMLSSLITYKKTPINQDK